MLKYFGLTSVRDNFQKLTVRIAVCNSGDHGVVCGVLILFYAFIIISVFCISTLFKDLYSTLFSFCCWIVTNSAFTLASNFCVVTYFSK